MVPSLRAGAVPGRPGRKGNYARRRTRAATPKPASPNNMRLTVAGSGAAVASRRTLSKSPWAPLDLNWIAMLWPTLAADVVCSRCGEGGSPLKRLLPGLATTGGLAD